MKKRIRQLIVNKKFSRKAKSLFFSFIRKMSKVHQRGRLRGPLSLPFETLLRLEPLSRPRWVQKLRFAPIL